MPKFLIERQYLVPMYKHIAVEAESLEEACKKAISDDIDWDTQEMDSDGARRTTITSIKVVPDGCDVDPKTELVVTRNEEDPSALDLLSFTTFLYENEEETGPAPQDPGAVHRRRIDRHAPLAAVEGACGVGAVRVATAARPISC